MLIIIVPSEWSIDMEIISQLENKWNKTQQNLLIKLVANHRDQDSSELEENFGSYRQAIAEADLLRSYIHDLKIISYSCQNSQIGKKLPTALYVHISTLDDLSFILRLYESQTRSQIKTLDKATIIKFNTDCLRICYLYYPDFDRDPHPMIKFSTQVTINPYQKPIIKFSDYSDSLNPPILHRKETFVKPDYPNYQTFLELTQQEEKLGLLSQTSTIGTYRGWSQCLAKYKVKIVGHQLIPLPSDSIATQIQRHRAAIVRQELSRPIKYAFELGLFSDPTTTFFDYGCGYGQDVERVKNKGFISQGWDPYYAPDANLIPSDIVNIGYVINVIECQAQRQEALIKAWDLTNKVLIVSSLVILDNPSQNTQVIYGDGIITKRNTFQKYYHQEELKNYIDEVLKVDAIPIALGLYLVFKDEAQAESFRAAKFRTSATTPKIIIPAKRFADYQEILEPLMSYFTERGRLPIKGIKPDLFPEIIKEFGSYHRAFQVILQVTKPEEWDAITEKRRQEILVYLALCSFKERRPRKFDPTLKNDIKGLFGTYKKACDLADDLLFSLGDLNIINQSVQNSPVGKLLGNGFYIHISALPSLDYRLRLYEACASQIIGRMDETTLIKIHTKSFKITYLYYPEFDLDPHPALQTSMKINLSNLNVTYQDYPDDPPLWHYKSQVINSDYPQYQKFAKQTIKEEKLKLLDEPHAIATRSSWLKYLADHGLEFHHNRLRWRKDLDPYQLKLIKAQSKLP